MKKFMTFAAVAALVLASCAKNEIFEGNPDDAIAFGAYAAKSLTKSTAAEAGEITDTKLQSTGFGVFAYQTTGDAALGTPNFMYNTKVSTSSWTYSPIKYWPNQISASGNTDKQTTPAQSEQADKVSFFAYGPYTAATASSGTATAADFGIIAFNANDVSGDPKVTYKISQDLDNQVDLVWGVVNPAANQTWNTAATGVSFTLDAGKPFLGLQKPALNQKIKFYFRHALAQIKLQAVAAFDQVGAGGTAKNNVKITIDEVVLSIEDQYLTAKLNLNNTTANTPKWESATGDEDLTLTVANANIATDLKYQGAQVQTNGGVTTTAQDVITDGKYFTIIPNTEGDITVNVKITYYITTPDTDLALGYSQTKNVISHYVTFAGGLAAGTKNTILMRLGLNEVKFDATVEEWVDGASGNVDLPLNN